MTTGIQALISKLRGVSVEEELGPDEFWICPIDINLVKIFKTCSKI